MLVTLGAIVVFTLADGPARGQDRPAIITNVLDDDTVDLVVFTRGDESRGDCLPTCYAQLAVPKAHTPQVPGHWDWRREPFQEWPAAQAGTISPPTASTASPPADPPTDVAPPKRAAKKVRPFSFPSKSEPPHLYDDGA